MAMFSAENVSLTIGNAQILWDISVQFEECQIHGIVGHNGSGKTIMKHICGFIHPAARRSIVAGNQMGRDMEFPPDLQRATERLPGRARPGTNGCPNTTWGCARVWGCSSCHGGPKTADPGRAAPAFIARLNRVHVWRNTQKLNRVFVEIIHC